MHSSIARNRSEIEGICQRFQMQRRELSGSAARGTGIEPEQSDADFLVEFRSGARRAFLRDMQAFLIGKH